MAKMDVTCDYYDILEVVRTASDEEIRRAFVRLAKKYHPDRNPGEELEFKAKFQAVQGAYEILSDPNLRREYDQKLGKRTPNTPRRGPVPPTPSPFPPPPQRAPTTATRQNPFSGNTGTTRARQPPASATAENYARYARAAAQQRENANEEIQSNADAFRGFQHMAPGHSPTGKRFAPPPPPRQTRYPTAPRPTSYAPQSAGPPPTAAPRPQKSGDDFNNAGPFSSRSEPSPGFPGLSRTQSTRKKQGFMPTTPGGDEPPAPRSSAYATYSRRERPPAASARSFFPETSTHPTPQMTPQRPLVSPLRHARSSPGIEERRFSTNYSKIGREKTAVTSAGDDRSSSARNSPIDSKWHEHHGKNGLRHSYSHEIPSRHRSSSPNTRPRHAHADSSSSDSETSSEDDFEKQWAARPKATPQAAPRQTHLKPASADVAGRPPSDGQAFTGQFPGINYVKATTPRDTDSGRYEYRPPPPPRNRPTSQAAFNYVPGHSEPRATAQHHRPGVGNGHVVFGEATGGPNMYAPFQFYPREWPKSFPVSLSRFGKSVPSLNGFPSWAVPSSVLPHKDTPKKHPLDTIREEKRTWIENWRSDACRSTFTEPPSKHVGFTDPALSDSSSSGTDTNQAREQTSFRSASQEEVSKGFSASEWNDKFARGEDLFRPTSSETQGKRSPVRPGRSRARSYNRTLTSPLKVPPNKFSSTANGGAGESNTTLEAFVVSNYSDEEWAQKFRYQTTTGPKDEGGLKSPKRGSNITGAKPQSTAPNPVPPPAQQGPLDALADQVGGSEEKAADNVDPMDIDDYLGSSVPPSPSDVSKVAGPSPPVANEKGHVRITDAPDLQAAHTAAGKVNLDDLSHVAPFKPSETGIGDLSDLNTTLPFESKASPARPSQILTNGTVFSSLKALNLPKPPKAVIPPLENVTAEAWARYTTEMSAYMHDWQFFNKKILDHFQARQAQLDMSMMPNWLSALGDGPSVAEMGGKTRADASISSNQKAGYAAYREWMEEDMRVREWWNVACERHRQAVIDLGRVREMAKPVAST